jgi:N-acetylmuramoyl-L-alanine amidase
MEIKNKRLDKQTAKFVESPNNSGSFGESLPDTIVIHYTAGSSTESSVDTLTNPEVRASAHLVIGRDGSVTQLVPFDTIAWHAGKSAWGDRSGLNKYSIGIELDNAGRLTKSGNQYSSWFGRTYSEEEVVHAIHRNEEEPDYWHRFTEDQISKVYEICRLLIDRYNIKTILGHEEISPGRKCDPGPAFPLDKLRDKLLHADRSDQEEQKLEDLDHPGEVTASLLNIRSGPSIDNQKIANPLQKGTVVDILDEDEDWYQVEIKLKGWVSKSYIKEKT